MRSWYWVLLVLAALAGGWCAGDGHGRQAEASRNTRIVLQAERDAWEGGQH